MGMRAYGFWSGHEEQDVWELVPFGVRSMYNDIVSAQQLEGGKIKAD